VTTKFLNSMTLATLVLLSAPGLVKAQNAYQGKFTLPFEAHWAGATLPAGDYTITLPQAVSPYQLYVRGEGKAAIISTVGVVDQAVSNDSALTLSKVGGGEAVTSLRAAELGLTFSYAIPKSLTAPQAEIKTVARVNVPVRTAGSSVAAR
jgi:hypothetical protein